MKERQHLLGKSWFEHLLLPLKPQNTTHIISSYKTCNNLVPKYNKMSNIFQAKQESPGKRNNLNVDVFEFI